MVNPALITFLLLIVSATKVNCTGFTINTSDGQEIVGSTFADYKTIILGKFGYLFDEPEVVEMVQKITFEALKDPQFARLAEKAAKDSLDSAEEKEMIELMIRQFGGYVEQVFDSSNMKITFED